MLKAFLTRWLVRSEEDNNAYNEQLEMINCKLKQAEEVRRYSIMIEHVRLLKSVKKTLRANGYKITEYYDEYAGWYTAIENKKYY